MNPLISLVPDATVTDTLSLVDADVEAARKEARLDRQRDRRTSQGLLAAAIAGGDRPDTPSDGMEPSEPINGESGPLIASTVTFPPTMNTGLPARERDRHVLRRPRIGAPLDDSPDDLAGHRASAGIASDDHSDENA